MIADVLIVMLDSCVYDELVADRDMRKALSAAIEEGSVAVLATHIQRDELTETPDEPKREALLECLHELAHTVPSSVFVLDHSRLDEARLGPFVDGEVFDGTFRTPREGRQDGMPGHTNDAIILDTSLAEGAVLVTNDEKRLMKVARKAGAKTLTVAEFFSRVRDRRFAAE
jgi:rRNA-processing protein FCF1